MSYHSNKTTQIVYQTNGFLYPADPRTATSETAHAPRNTQNGETRNDTAQHTIPAGTAATRNNNTENITVGISTLHIATVGNSATADQENDTYGGHI